MTDQPILKNPDEYRGCFLHEFAKLEYEIDYFLAGYFVGATDLQNHLISILIDRIPFENKRTALKALLELIYPKKNGKHNQNFGKMLDEIGKSARIRNEYAHYHTVNYQITDNGVPITAIALAKLRDDHKIIHYSVSDFYKQIESIRLSAKTIRGFTIEMHRVRAGTTL